MPYVPKKLGDFVHILATLDEWDGVMSQIQAEPTSYSMEQKYTTFYCLQKKMSLTVKAQEQRPAKKLAPPFQYQSAVSLAL